MSAVSDAIEDVGDFVGDVFESVGDAIGDVADVAFDIVEDVGDFVGDVVQGALDDPIGTIAKVAAVSTGNAWALPYISAGSVIVNGGSLEDAIIAGGTTYVVQGVVDYISGADAAVPGDLDYGPSIPDTSVTPYTIVPGDFDYGPPSITVEDLYRQYAGRASDPGGLAFWEAGFGDTIDANEIASFQQAVADARAAGTEPQPVTPTVSTPPVSAVIPDVLPDVSEITDWQPTYGPPTEVAAVTPDTITDAGPVQPGITTGGDAPYQVDVGGAAGTAEAPQYVTDPSQLTPGSVLATLEQIDAGTATWNPAANAWETAPPLSGSLDAGPGAYPYTPGITLPDTVPVATVPTPVAPVDLGPYPPLDVPPGPLPDWYTGTTTPVLPPWMPAGTTTIVNADGTTGYVIGSLVYDPTGQITGYAPVTTPVTPYDPYTDQGPSQPGVVTPGPVVPPGDTVTDLGTIPVTDTRPVTSVPPEIVITAPYTPPPVDNTVVNVIADTPPDVFTPTPVDNTVVPVDVTPPPVDVTTPPIDLTPYIPILVPPIVSTPDTPPPYTPPVAPTVRPNVIGNMLNPGYIQPTAFYNTTDPAQSQFYWGGHGPQFGPAFNAEAYNQVAAPNTPFGISQVARPLSPADYAAIAAGTYQPPAAVAPATRAQAYRAPTQTAPSYGQVQVGGPVAPSSIAPAGRSGSMYTPEQMTRINTVLGADWQARQDRAALNSDYATIADIQNQISSALAPVSSQTPS